MTRTPRGPSNSGGSLLGFSSWRFWPQLEVPNGDTPHGSLGLRSLQFLISHQTGAVSNAHSRLFVLPLVTKGFKPRTHVDPAKSCACPLAQNASALCWDSQTLCGVFYHFFEILGLSVGKKKNKQETHGGINLHFSMLEVPRSWELNVWAGKCFGPSAEKGNTAVSEPSSFLILSPESRWLLCFMKSLPFVQPSMQTGQGR